MADDDAARLAQCLDEPDDVTGEVEQAVAADLSRCLALAIAALVGGDRVEAGSRQGLGWRR